MKQAPISAPKTKGGIYAVIAMEVVVGWGLEHSRNEEKQVHISILTPTLGKENVSLYTLHGSETMKLIHSHGLHVVLIY